MHCTTLGLTPAIIPNANNSTVQFLVVGACVRASSLQRQEKNSRFHEQPRALRFQKHEQHAHALRLEWVRPLLPVIVRSSLFQTRATANSAISAFTASAPFARFTPAPAHHMRGTLPRRTHSRNRRTAWIFLINYYFTEKLRMFTYMILSLFGSE